jgi:uncharacterized damage-inducible protein DinB
MGGWPMTEVERIADQIKRALDGPAWHGPSVNEILSGVDSTLAGTLPKDGVHTIWELLLHISVWIRIVRMRIDGERTPKDIDPKQDWPSIEDSSEAAWTEAVRQLRTEYELLINHCLRLTDAELSKPVPGMDYTYYFILHGVVQHTLYHAGQMAFIKSSSMKRIQNAPV